MRADTQFRNAPRRRFIAVDWQDCAWQPRIEVRNPVPPRGRAGIKSLSVPRFDFYSSRRNSISPKTMKTNLPCPRRHRAGFTLVELLTVITIIGILAALLLPVLSAAKEHARIMKARTEISQLDTAIQAYDSAYGRFPVSAAAQAAASPDFTYGGSVLASAGFTGASISSNYDVVAILMDLTNYPGGGFTVNTNHQKNPQQTIFLNAKMSVPVSGGVQQPGVGTDLVYRDPWGNPYVISMDLNYDEQCQDAFYCKDKVSYGGLNGLVDRTDPTGADNNWQYHGKVMVWSAGPDGRIDPNSLANQGANKDNILSWK
jgi:prepilin-type N-terminal cleavage/methylation domain-containing protein